jgi:hypothetical protein
VNSYGLSHCSKANRFRKPVRAESEAIAKSAEDIVIRGVIGESEERIHINGKIWGHLKIKPVSSVPTHGPVPTCLAQACSWSKHLYLRMQIARTGQLRWSQ